MRRVVVSQCGKGDYRTVQEAVNSVADNCGEKVEIFIKSGKYYEKLVVSETKSNIVFIGEELEKTIIEYDDYALKLDEEGKPLTTYRTPSVTIKANDFKAKNITFINSAGVGDVVGQAVAVQVLGDRCVFKNCKFLAFQDTFYTKSEDARIYVKECFIEGDVDFIFGASTAVFEKCIISSINKPGFVSAPSTPITKEYGYLFDRCKLVSNLPKKTVYLGRPWHPAGDPDAIASVVFRECELGEHIRDEAWTEMKGFKSEDARMYEYRNFGLGAKQHKLRRELSESDAEKYTADKMLKGIDNWDFREEF